MTNLDELDRLAKAATPGPWYSAHHGVNTHGTGAQHDICRVSMTTGNYESEQENRDFIAATNPAAILALIAEVRALREFHGFFRDRCESLFGEFGMDAIDLYNAAAVAARKEKA